MTPTANAARGRVPAYDLVDVNAAYDLTSRLRIGASVSNLFDARYYTKRPTFYPGPGIWPSDGIGMRATVEARW